MRVGTELKIYLPLALAAFLAATTGSDLIARTSIAGETLRTALGEHLRLAADEAVGTLFLFIPFAGVAFICALAQKRARTRSTATLFAASMLALLYCYYIGYQGSQQALLEGRWTAAALSVGLLPFFVGIPLLLIVALAGALAAAFDRRTSA